jgi:hypothetical protein
MNGGARPLLYLTSQIDCAIVHALVDSKLFTPKRPSLIIYPKKIYIITVPKYMMSRTVAYLEVYSGV